jgi:hypothetical protein
MSPCRDKRASRNTSALAVCLIFATTVDQRPWNDSALGLALSGAVRRSVFSDHAAVLDEGEGALTEAVRWCD